MSDTATINPEIERWTGPLDLPRYDRIEDTDFLPAIREGFRRELVEIEAIADNPHEPDFGNTIAALEMTGDLLARAASLFYTKTGNHTNPVLQAAEREIGAEFARHSGRIASNRRLFSRIEAVWETRESAGLTEEQLQILTRVRRGFVQGGAALSETDQARLIAINERLATLGTAFAQNVLHDEADWFMLVDETAALDALPASLRAAMAAAAAERGHEGAHAVTLARSIVEPFLTFCPDRNLREQAFLAWTRRGEHDGEHDNRPVIAETVALRAEKARLLGHENFAGYRLEATMAKTPGAVQELLGTVWPRAVARAGEEASDIAAMMRADGINEPPRASDWRHYAEKIRTQRFALSDDEVKPYMALDNMIEAAFDVAHRLFAIRFREIANDGWLHPDARIWEVLNDDGSHRGVFIGDYFARSSKRSGAWMSGIRSQSRLKGDTPVITNTMNFAKPPAGGTAFLSFDDARTLFHEFGHALHGLMSDVTYPGLSGTSVSRDFVELPSQLYEHWLTVPAVLNRFARHAQTGEPMPEDLIGKIKAAETFNAGFQTVEYTACALVDMAFHAGQDVPADPVAFEAAELARIGMPEAIAMRHRSPHFQHIFSGEGYAAGYYAYMWSEVLDADAFRAFEEKGDPFDPEVARRLKTFIYGSGGSMDPEAAYIAFRGKLPTPDAMLEGRGLA